MKRVETYFFELLQVAIGNRHSLTGVPTPEEWEELYDISKKQTLVGIAFKGVEKLPQEQLPPPRRLRQWYVKADKLKEKNQRVTEECKYVTMRFKQNGFYSCILKGQSMLPNYPETLRSFRTPGDVDVWIRPCTKLREKFNEHRKSWVEKFMLLDDFYIIGKYVNSISKEKDDVVYHHFHCDLLSSNTVEVHVTPAFFMNPFKNRKLQKLFDDNWKYVQQQNVKETEDGFYTMPLELNVVFLISHFYRHLILEGVGMRQLMDVYFALKRYMDSNTASKPSELMRKIEDMGMCHVTSAIMWVLKECYGMKKEYLLCSPSQKYGRHLLDEMMNGGNFGHNSEDAGKMYSGETSAIRFWRSCKYGMRLILYYPGETLWVPFNNAKQSIIKNYYRKHPI